MVTRRTIQTRWNGHSQPRNRMGLLGGSARGAASIPATAFGGGTPLSVTYPSSIDAPPVPLDGTAILSAIWLNFLSEIIEAVEGEIGQLGNGSSDQLKWIGGQSNLSKMLNELQIASGTNAGKLKGLTKVTITKVGTAYATVARATISLPQARTNADPIVFGTSLLTSGITIGDWADGPAMVRGVAFAFLGLSIDYLGARVGSGYASGGNQGLVNPAPTSTKTFTTELTLFNM